MQTTSHILMIRPVAFGYNAETAVNNTFQLASEDDHVNEKAQQEFDQFVQVLRSHHVDVMVVDDTAIPHTPDSIFPNNWVSFHENGKVVLYPMYALNRRKERQKNVLQRVENFFWIKSLVDITCFEDEQLFLEGTGSMVLDRENKIAYACNSPRTSIIALLDFCGKMGYKPVTFAATDQNNREIYHTNVMMCVTDKYAVICLESIQSDIESDMVKDTLMQTGKKIIEITREQMNQFAGNMLQVQNSNGEKLLAMSTQAYKSFTEKQITELEAFNPIVHSPLYTIEQNGGGSARCMMAEIFLPSK